MTEVELERMVVRIVGDASLYERMLLRAQMMTEKTAKTLKRLGRDIEAFGASMMRTGRNLSLALTLPIGIWVRKSVEEFRKFNLAMTETFAKMGRVTPELRHEMEELTKSMSMSGSTVFSPTELAMGYEALASAGLDAARSMKALPSVARFAQAGAFDLNQAVKLIIGSMASFGQLSKDPIEFSKNLEHFSDVIVSVANETTTGVEQVARAMAADAAVAAKQYGMSLEELGAILGVFALQNKDAEEAGNLTGRAIRLMTDTFIRKQAVWKSMGIDLVDKATGKWIKFADAIGMLEQAFKGMTGPQMTATLRTLGFKTLTLKAILPLIGMSDELRRQTKLYEEVGTTAEMAGIQAESFSAQMTTVLNNIKAVDIEVGEILAPLLLRVGESIKEWATYWKTLTLEQKQNILIVIGLVAATGPLLLALGVLIWSVGMAITGFLALRTGLSLLVTGIQLGVTAWAMFGNALLLAISNMGVTITTVASLRAALVALGPAIVLVVAAVAVAGANALGKWLFGVHELNRALEKTKELNELISGQMSHGRNMAVQNIMNIEDPEQRFQALQAAIIEAKKNVEGYKASVKGAETEVAKLNTWWNYISGNKVLEVENSELQNLKGNAKAALEHLRSLQLTMQGMKPGVVPGGMPLADAVPLGSDIQEDTDQLIAKLEEEYATFGIAQGYVEAYKLALKGLDEDTYNYMVSLIAQNEAMQAQVDLQEEITGMVASLRQQIDTFGQSAGEVAAYELALKGATYQEIQHVLALHEQLDGMKAYQDQVEKAKSITEKYMSPQEKLAKTQGELFDLFGAGLITLETYNAALADAYGQTNKDYTVKFGVQGVEAVAAGSADALARINEFRHNMSITPMGPGQMATFGGGQFNPGQAQPQAIPVKPIPQKGSPGDLKNVEGYLQQLVVLAQAQAGQPTVTLEASNLGGG